MARPEQPSGRSTSRTSATIVIALVSFAAAAVLAWTTFSERLQVEAPSRL
jgi:hypothetical protein